MIAHVAGYTFDQIQSQELKQLLNTETQYLLGAAFEEYNSDLKTIKNDMITRT